MRNLYSIGYMDAETYHFQLHRHDHWEISYYFQGSGISTVGDREIPFQPGVIICQPPEIPHAEYAENGYRNIYFCVGAMDGAPDKVQIYTDNETRIIHHLLMQTHAEFHLRRKNWRSISESFLQTAYQYMLSFSQERITNPYVELLQNLLVSNLSNRSLSIDRLMREVPLSKDHARRLFVRETGKTPTEYLTEKRIQYARQLIGTRTAGSGTSIKEIAALCGFDDPYYFSRVFRKLTGKSPSTWSPENMETRHELV